MSAPVQETRLSLLRDLSQIGGRGRAEHESVTRIREVFHPVAEHLRALDPEVVLIVGPRGAGKSQLFKAITDAGLVPAIARHAPSLQRLPSDPTKSKWLSGYRLEKQDFDPRGLLRFLDKFGQESETVADLWFSYLVRVLAERLDEHATERLKGVLLPQAGDPEAVFLAFRQTEGDPLLALDRLDDALEKRGEYVFVAYDELDTLGGTDWNAMTVGIQGLVALWATYSRRWRRIRAKIFLRTDLFERHATSGGADLAKLAAGRVDLFWSERSLYSMLLKRIVNASPRLEEYLLGARRNSWSHDSDLGWIPTLQRWEDARPAIERIIGPYMGVGVKKGRTYRWLIDHVRDGRGRALPRPFVRLIEEAAWIEADAPRSVRWPRIIHPTSLRSALDKVSDEYVEHAKAEWPWLQGIKERVKGEQVPWERRRDLERLLEPSRGGGENRLGRPPFDDPRELVEYLVEVGVFRRRPDERIDVPDLFLYGLGLKRKGGVRQR